MITESCSDTKRPMMSFNRGQKDEIEDDCESQKTGKQQHTKTKIIFPSKERERQQTARKQ